MVTQNGTANGKVPSGLIFTIVGVMVAVGGLLTSLTFTLNRITSSQMEAIRAELTARIDNVQSQADKDVIKVKEDLRKAELAVSSSTDRAELRLAEALASREQSLASETSRAEARLDGRLLELERRLQNEVSSLDVRLQRELNLRVDRLNKGDDASVDERRLLEERVLGLVRNVERINAFLETLKPTLE